MRYPASEKAEIIRLVEQTALPVKRTLEKLAMTNAKRPRGDCVAEAIRVMTSQRGSR